MNLNDKEIQRRQLISDNQIEILRLQKHYPILAGANDRSPSYYFAVLAANREFRDKLKALTK